MTQQTRTTRSNISHALQIALDRHRSGNLPDAERIYRQVLAQKPDHPDALHLQGLLLWQVGRTEEAIGLFEKAVAAKPSFGEAHFNLGKARLSIGKTEAGVNALKRALQLNPDSADALRHLGHGEKLLGNMPEAILAYRKILKLEAGDFATHANLAKALMDQRDLDAALASYRQAARLAPRESTSYVNLGVILAVLKRRDEAKLAFERAIELDPGSAMAYRNLGNIHREMGDIDQAVAVLRKAIELKPDYFDARSNLAVALAELGKLDEALPAFRNAFDLKSDCATTHWNYSLALLTAGDFERGWREYEWRWRWEENRSPRRNFPQPLWDGGDIGGRRILLHAEQGLGDSIQFLRYVPLVAARGAKVIVECQAELQRLARQIPGAEDWIVQGHALPEFDVHCPLLSLPMAMGTTVQSIPAGEGYLRPDKTDVENWQNKISGDPPGRRIGLVWAGSPTHVHDDRRSMPLESFGPLAAIAGTVFYSLQKGPAAEQIHRAPAGLNLIDHTAELGDFSDTAALIAQLDLLITVDTSCAHLAGAMGKRVWVLLPFTPDWRWMRDREDSPWYPAVRLFRQPSPGDWPTVIERVANALRGE